MNTHTTDWPAARIVHLTGGCRAINVDGPPTEFQPRTLAGGKVQFRVHSYKTLYLDLKNNGLVPIGLDFYSSSLETTGHIPPDWRSYHPSNDTPWPCQFEIDRASHIGHAAFRQKNARLWDIASRLSHQLRVSSWRLRQISEAYQDQLHARLNSKEFCLGSRFIDSYTWLAYLSIQAFLVDACVFRDYLAEFYASFVCTDTAILERQTITAMGSLRKRVLEKTKIKDETTTELVRATEPGGWLHTLGAYRDLVVHCAPIASAETRLMALCSEIAIGTTASIPAITLPIPADPTKISKSRSSGTHFQDLENEFLFFVRANRGDTPSSDGLIYCYTALGELARLTKLILDRSPIEPEIIHITNKDINGKITVKKV